MGYEFGRGSGRGGNSITDHKIKSPGEGKLKIGLQSFSITDENSAPLEEKDIFQFRQQVQGWRVEKTDSGFRLEQDFKVKDEASGKILQERFQGIAQSSGHTWSSLTQPDSKVVRVELATAKGSNTVSLNDLILANKLNDCPMTDLAPP